MRFVRKRLTYANVMSSLAVFLIVAGGTAFAAGKLGKNTVGTKQLKNNAVTGAKIKKEAVTGAKIKLSSLGKVPSASTADTAGTANSANSAKTADTANTANTANVANSLAPPEAVHIVGSPGQPGFEGGSSNITVSGLGAIVNPVGFWKDHDGVVHLQGIAETGNAISIDPIFTLPPGFRPTPTKIMIFPGTLSATEPTAALIAGESTVIEGVNLSDKVSGSEESSILLDGITFRAEG
jgi:hypothetical protein